MLGFNDGRDWFLSRHYGMFIHWGIYSVGGRSEWERKKFGVPKEEYDKYIVMLRSYHEKRKESLAEYYFRTNRHLLGAIKVAEYDPETKELRVVGVKDR